MTSKRILAALAALCLGCEGMSFDAQVGGDAERAPREADTPRERPQPTRPRTTGSPGWERGSKPVEVPIEGAYDESHSVRFEPREPRVQAGGTREVTVVLVGPELFEPLSFLMFSRHADLAEVPAGVVTFDTGERRAVIVVETKALQAGSSGEAVISFESIDFARPQRFDCSVVLTEAE